MMPLEKEPLCSTNQVGSESPQVPNLGSLDAKLVFVPTSAQHRANIAQHKESTASISLINCCPSSSVCQLITLFYPTVPPCLCLASSDSPAMPRFAFARHKHPQRPSTTRQLLARRPLLFLLQLITSPLST